LSREFFCHYFADFLLRSRKPLQKETVTLLALGLRKTRRYVPNLFILGEK
jgi:hypothetical protein